MKRFRLLLATFAFVFSVSAVHAVDLDIKAGVSSPKDPDSVSFDAALSLNIPLVPMSGDGGVGFYLGINPGFNWTNWDETVSTGVTATGLPIQSKNESNLIFAPMLVNLELRFPVYLGDRMSAFNVGVGAGYGIGIYDYTSADKTTTGEGSFAGLVAQAYLGMAINLNNNLFLLADVGYRYSEIKGDLDETVGSTTTSITDATLDMTGITAHLGVRIAFGGGGY